MERGTDVGRGAQSLARVAVIVRAGAAPLWWPGLLAAAIGALVPGLTGRRIGLLAGAALFLITAAAVALVRDRRYAELAGGATRAGRSDFLQDRAVTVRNWRRGHRWWLLGAFLVAVASAFVLPGAAGWCSRGRGPGSGPRPSGSGGASAGTTPCTGYGPTGWSAAGPRASG